MQKIALDEIKPGDNILLAHPVILGSGVKGFNAGVAVTERVVDALKKLGFTEVWVCGSDEEFHQIITGGDEMAEGVSQHEKFMRIKEQISASLADIMTEKDPQREILKIKTISRKTILMKRGELTKIKTDRPSWEVRDLKKFAKSIISTVRLEELMKACRDLLENEFSARSINKVHLNLNDTRMEESYLYNHMANCGLYFLATAAKYNSILKSKGAVSSALKYARDFKRKEDTLFFFTDEETLSGALAAFMHDVGYLHDGMPEIFLRHGTLTKEEHRVLEKHVEVSMNIVSHHIFFANRPLATTTIENHHERLDGTGYPRGRRNFHAFSRIINIIDVFDSMVNDRPWRKKFARSKVLEWLYQNSESSSDPSGKIKEGKFDRELFLCFESILNLYELGESVDLYHAKTSTSVFKAKIKENNSERPDRPVVELVSCIADPNRNVAGKVMNLRSVKDLYIGETADFNKEPIT